MVIILGKTCSGKDTIVNKLCNEYGYKKIITYTTRPMRDGEINGKTYHFITKEEFLEKINNKFFLEYKKYNTTQGEWYYGCSFEDINNADEKSVIILTPMGYLDLLYFCPAINHKSIYLKVDEDIIKQRLIERGDNKEEAERRLINDNKDFSTAAMIVDKVICNNNLIEDVIKEIIYE